MPAAALPLQRDGGPAGGRRRPRRRRRLPAHAGRRAPARRARSAGHGPAPPVRRDVLPRLWTRARAWRERVARLYRAAYGSGELVVFEHGPGRSQGGGACIDHAHWHFLPGRLAIRQVVEDRGLPGKPAGHGAVRDRVLSGRSYLLLDQDDCLTVHPGDTVPSQFLRWAVLAALDATAQPPRDGFVHPAAPGTGPRNDDERTNRPGNEAGQERPVWRWQELFGLPDSRARFLRTLAALRSAVDEVQRDDSHQ
ncbi:hypothetical protein ACFQHO_41495 [Actinomadura yumaensis]|uniref:hypothetical protein n=1 Tax=Actinomadura yumaensis TaxID=111807 RepID=UPI00361107D0